MARFATPIAILIAGAFIAIATYFGLRSQSPAIAPVPLAASSPSRTSAPTKIPVSKEEATARTKAALELQRAQLTKKCWEPLAKLDPKSPPARWEFDFTFDAEGKQLARGVSDLSDGGRVDITNCVVDALLPVAIAPPKGAIRVEVTFALP